MELELSQFKVDESVFRLILPVRDVRADLVRRGVQADGLDETEEAVRDNDVPQTLEEAVDYSFTAHDGQSYAWGRFGDGTYGVFYSATEEKTAIEEVRHHSKQRLLEDGLVRSMWMIECKFVGTAASLVGMETEHPELVSQDESGYPFCQGVARQAIAEEIEGLHSPSARLKAGVCVPVFAKDSIANPVRRRGVRFSLESLAIKVSVNDVD